MSMKKRIKLFLVTGCAIFARSVVTGVEVVVTKEWQLLGENDTIPAGMHVRMDMTTGEKWVKEIDENDDTSQMIAAVVEEDGTVRASEALSSSSSNGDNEDTANAREDEPNTYDYEMMHRTLAALPEQEKERMGGIPELPPTSARTPIKSKEREAVEARLAEIWEKRQEELIEMQELLMDVPEVLKERMQGIRGYLVDPLGHLRSVDFNEDHPEGVVTHIVSILQDLEFQLADVDNARDFHTMGGWQLLVSLLSEDMNTPNTTISSLPSDLAAKIRSVQANAAWAIGTAVKNTGEFSPYAVEKVQIKSGGIARTITAIDMALEVFCKDYNDFGSWEVRTLLAKGIYAIGALVRGNRLAQAQMLKSGEPNCLSNRLRQLAKGELSSANIKLIQRLLSLASDVVTDIQLHGEDSMASANDAILRSFTNDQWCEATGLVLLSVTELSVSAQETLLDAIETVAPYCSQTWGNQKAEYRNLVDKMARKWHDESDNFDPDHLHQLIDQAERTMKVL